MNFGFESIAREYSSGSQIARLKTEAWIADNLFCPCCFRDRLVATKANTKALDFVCGCGECFQLKAGKGMPKARIVGAAYKAMIDAVHSDSAPNLLYMHYSNNAVKKPCADT